MFQSKFYIYMLGDLHITSATPISRIDNYTETIFGKIEYVFKEASLKLNDVSLNNEVYILLPGDLFHTTSQPDSIKNKLIDLIKKYNLSGRILAVYGNHDSVYYNSDFNYKTSLGILDYSGVVTMLSNSPLRIKRRDAELNTQNYLSFWGLSLEEITSKKFLEYKYNDSKFNILVAHAFLEADDRLTIPLEFVQESNLTALLLGHDHNQYPVNKIGNTLVFRPGALSRATSATESKNRRPSYAVLELDGDNVSYEMCVVPHKPAEEVYRYKSAEETSKVEKVNYDVIKSFIVKLGSMAKENNPFTVLKSMNLDTTEHDRCLYYLNASGLKNNVEVGK